MEDSCKKPPTEGVHDWPDVESRAEFGKYLLEYCRDETIPVAEKTVNPVFPRKSGTQHP